jgi:hypothetical protein
MHTVNNNQKKVSSFLKPPAHGRPGYGNRLSTIDTLLAVKRQMAVKFRDSYVGNQAWRRVAFINRLVWFRDGNNLTLTTRTSIGIFHMLKQLKDRLEYIELLRASKANDFARLTATGTGKISKFMLNFQTFRGILMYVPAAATVLFFFRNNAEIGAFRIKLRLVAVVDSLAGASKGGCRNLGGAFAKDSAVAAADLLFEFSDTLLQEVNSFGNFGQTLQFSTEVFDEVVAIGDIVGEVVVVIQMGIGHGFAPVDRIHYTIQYTTCGIKGRSISATIHFITWASWNIAYVSQLVKILCSIGQEER